MSKAVLMSIRPSWVDKIASGEKTVELRKSWPRFMMVPFKVYIYMTKHEDRLIDVLHDGDTDYLGDTHHGKSVFIKIPEGSFQYQRGKVVGEFVCDAVSALTFDRNNIPTLHYSGPAKPWRTCVTKEAALKYCGDAEERGLWAWHISELKMYRYDQAKDLTDFKRPCNLKPDCFLCKNWVFANKDCKLNRGITTAPKSWCYVEEQE